MPACFFLLIRCSRAEDICPNPTGVHFYHCYWSWIELGLWRSSDHLISTIILKKALQWALFYLSRCSWYTTSVMMWKTQSSQMKTEATAAGLSAVSSIWSFSTQNGVGVTKGAHPSGVSIYDIQHCFWCGFFSANSLMLVIFKKENS